MHGGYTKPSRVNQKLTKRFSCEPHIMRRVANITRRIKMTRTEHLQWCKQRALEYVNSGDLPQAFASMGSDLNKHPETKNHSAIQLGMMMMMSGHLDTAEEMRRFIEGFN